MLSKRAAVIAFNFSITIKCWNHKIWRGKILSDNKMVLGVKISPDFYKSEIIFPNMKMSRIESCLVYEVNTGKYRGVRKAMAEVWLTIRRRSAAIC
jgi:hypothetical protein